MQSMGHTQKAVDMILIDELPVHNLTNDICPWLNMSNLDLTNISTTLSILFFFLWNVLLFNHFRLYSHKCSIVANYATHVNDVNFVMNVSNMYYTGEDTLLRCYLRSFVRSFVFRDINYSFTCTCIHLGFWVNKRRL